MPPPSADFACLSKKCATDEGAPTYELPVAATRCPVCGSKRITRIWTPPAILRSGQRAITRLVDQAGAEAQLAQHTTRDARLAAEKSGNPVRAVPIRQIAPTLAAMGGRQVDVTGKAAWTPDVASPILSQVQRRLPRPGPGSLAERNKRS